MCGAHAAVRSILGAMIDGSRHLTVVDIEAGLEHLSRGTARHADTLLAVMEPYYKSMETAARVAALARELGVAEVYVVANKVRDETDRAALDQFCRQRDLPLVGVVPDDEVVREADRRGVGPLDVTEDAPSIHAIAAMAERLAGP